MAAISHVYKDFRGILDANNCKNIVVSVMIHGARAAANKDCVWDRVRGGEIECVCVCVFVILHVEYGEKCLSSIEQLMHLVCCETSRVSSWLNVCLCV